MTQQELVEAFSAKAAAVNAVVQEVPSMTYWALRPRTSTSLRRRSPITPLATCAVAWASKRPLATLLAMRLNTCLARKKKCVAALAAATL